eukprot:3449308-Rhodomonas_salina.3
MFLLVVEYREPSSGGSTNKIPSWYNSHSRSPVQFVRKQVSYHIAHVSIELRAVSKEFQSRVGVTTLLVFSGSRALIGACKIVHGYITYNLDVTEMV